MSESEMNGNASTTVSASTGCQVTATTSTQRKVLEVLAQQVAQTSEQRRNVVAKIETMRQAQQAAQGEADAARGQWAVKLRESDGAMTREVQKLRAAERSALSLVEEYRDVAAELESEVPRIGLELAIIASDAIKTRDAIVAEVASEAYGELLEQAGDGLALALALFSTARNAGLDHRTKEEKEVLAAEFFARLNVDVCHRLSSPSVERAIEARLALPSLELSETDKDLVSSPAARAKLRSLLKA